MNNITQEEIKKVNTAILGLANSMEKASEMIKRRAIKVETTKFSKSFILSFLASMGFVNSYLADGTYYLTGWETWKKIIKWDWTDKRKYLDDRYDCDNFAESFSSMAAATYGLNSAAKAKNTRIDKPFTDIIWGHHRHNLIIANEREGMKAYLYEPMNDNYLEIKRNEPIVMGGWEYNLKNLEIN